MLIDVAEILRRNFQRISTNRFVVDSPRFWREEYHPRFKDIFQYSDFQDVINQVNNEQSFPLSPVKIDALATRMYEFFSDFRFAAIPAKEPTSPGMFLADLYFTLEDYLPGITIEDFPLTMDDFNLVQNKAETGKNDTSKVGTSEAHKAGMKHDTELDILTNTRLSQQDIASTENIDDETKQNTTQINELYNSPQDQGVKPNTTNTQYEGVNGIPIQPDAKFTTTTQNTFNGDTTKGKTNTSAQSQQANSEIQQNNDAKTAHGTTNEFGADQYQENGTAKSDNYMESLDFNRGARLHDFYDLYRHTDWAEIFGRLSRWILQAHIATAERNYLDCPEYV